MKTSIVLKYVNKKGQTKQKSFTDIDATATNANIVAFTKAINLLTTNTYVSTTRIDQINCDTEADK